MGGKKDKLRPGDLLGALTGDAGLSKDQVGKINVFDEDGRFIDGLDDKDGKTLVIDRLWTLTLGGGRTSKSDTLYFTAGPAGETHGLFGTITPVLDPSDNE